jgi:TonB family protein
MHRQSINCLSLIITIFLTVISLNAQIKKTQLKQITVELQEEEKALGKCQPKGLRISHFCYDFCPTNLVKPQYNKDAQKLGIRGQVRIEVIINEAGKVINAKVLESKPFISQDARRAALRSSFQPRRNCDNKLIKFRGTIIYNFH